MQYSLAALYCAYAMPSAAVELVREKLSMIKLKHKKGRQGRERRKWREENGKGKERKERRGKEGNKTTKRGQLFW